MKMVNLYLYVGIIFLILSVEIFSATLHVPGQYTTIQSAINSSANGDTVLVAAGIYVGAINFNNKLIILISESGASTTTISGNNAASTVTFTNAENNSTQLFGFTITGGNPYGVVCNGSSTPIISNCIFQNNSKYPIVIAISMVGQLLNSMNSFIPRGDGKFNAIYVRGGTINESVTWPVPPTQFCYRILNDQDITIQGSSNPVLTLLPGTVIKMYGNSSVVVGGNSATQLGMLMADGVLFTSSVDDTTGDTNGDGTASIPAPNNWEGIWFYNYADDNSLVKNCLIRYGGKNAAGIYMEASTPRIEDNTIYRVSNTGISVKSVGMTTQIRNNTILRTTSDNIYPFQLDPMTMPDVIMNNNYPARTDGKFNAIYVRGGTINESVTWPVPPTQFCYRILNDQDITIQGSSNPVLTLLPGTVIKMYGNSSVVVGGNSATQLGMLMADGVLFTSSVDDTTGDTNGDGTASIPAPNNWEGIWFYNYADDNSLVKNCLIRYGGKNAAGIYMEASTPRIEDNTIYRVSNTGISVKSVGMTTQIRNNTILRTTSDNIYPFQLDPMTMPDVIMNNNYPARTDGKFNAIYVRGGTINESVTWPVPPTGYCYWIQESTDISVIGNPQPELTLLAGTVIELWNNSSFIIGGNSANQFGKLTAQGVTFTSAEDDTTGDTNGNNNLPGPNEWEGISFYNYADDNSLVKNCLIRYGGKNAAGIYMEASTPRIEDNTIYRVSNTGISVKSVGMTTQIRNNTILRSTSDNIYPFQLDPMTMPDVIMNNNYPARTDGKFNAIYVRGGTINESVTWPVPPTGYCYWIQESTDISVIGNPQPELTLLAGTVIELWNNSSFIIGGNSANQFGKLTAQGVTFTSAEDDTTGDTNGNNNLPGPNEWEGISFYNYADDNSLVKNCLLRYGGKNSHGLIYINSASPTIDSCRITRSGSSGILATGVGANPLINKCIIEANTTNGVLAQSSANPVINFCDIVANYSYGVSNTTSSILIDAENNFWGDTTGPYHLTLNPNGKGDKVTDYVSFQPFLSSSVWGKIYGYKYMRTSGTIVDCVGPTDNNGRYWYETEFNDASWDIMFLPDNWGTGSSDRYYRQQVFLPAIYDSVKLSFASNDGIWIYANSNFVGHWGPDCHGNGCVNGTGCGINSSVPAQNITSFVQPGSNSLAFHVSNGPATGYFYSYHISVYPEAGGEYLTLTSPIGGEIWPQGTIQQITWAPTEISNIDIDLSTDNGNSWTNLINNYPTSIGAYDWNIDNPGSQECKIKISESSTGFPNYTSNSFTVLSAILLNNGDLVFNGYNYLIKWTAPSEPHKLVFYFSDSTSSYRPTGFGNGDSLVIETTSNYYLLTFNTMPVAAKYYWKVYDKNWNAVTSKNAFMLVNLIPPNEPTVNPPIILVHGWRSNKDMWDVLKTGTLSSEYSLWIFEYPNTGDIIQSAWGLSVAIDSVLSNSPGNTKVRILSHSMGGLVTRAYTVNMAKNLLQNSIPYNNNLEYVAFLATPNHGGLNVDLVYKIIGNSDLFGGRDQYALYQLLPNSDFLNTLNSFPLVSDIKYLSVAGYDNRWLLLAKLLGNIVLNKQIANMVLSLGVSDCVVKLESAIKGPSGFFDQYKIIYRNHLNIFDNPISPVSEYLSDFFYDGIIQSDNYANYAFKKIVGNLINLPFRKVQENKLANVEINITPDGQEDSYVTYSNFDGSYYINFLPNGMYKVKVYADGYIADSTTITVNDSLYAAPCNFRLNEDSTYSGPTNQYVKIEGDTPFTNNLLMDLELNANNATQMKISDNIDFEGANWISYATNSTFTFSDSSFGPKTIFVKYKSLSGIESTIAMDDIIYSLQSFSQVNVTSNPQGARVYFDGTNMNGATPLLIENIPPNEYTFSVNKSGYSSWPTIIPITVAENQSYDISFTFTNSAPQTVKYLFGISYSDTLQLEWVSPSDADIMFIQINYRLDGIFPVDPNDGITLVSQSSQPDELHTLNVSGLQQGTTYHLSAFTIDSASNHSIPKTLAILIGPNTNFQLNVNIANGWNMVSVPGINPNGQGVNNWWSGLAGTVYKFIPGSGYTGITTTTPGEGYWMKQVGDNVYNTGDEWPAGGIQIVSHDPINAIGGWNIFGGYEDVVDVTTLSTTPSGQIVYPIYKYVPGTGYQTATTLDPGYGYWVKVSSDCQINVPSVMAKGNKEVAEYFKKDWGRITITDAAGSSYTLYAIKGGSPNEGVGVDLNRYELPPLPPEGLFDIRYSSGRIAEDINTELKSIDMRGVTYPIKVKAENMDIRLMDVTGKLIDINIKKGEEITISNSNIDKVMVSGQLLPKKFALEQNYPNPFNPTTTIKFSIPKQVQVNLVIYDILGEEVKELKNEVMKPGYYEVNFNANALASGVYFYRIKAGDFVQTKKMILLK